MIEKDLLTAADTISKGGVVIIPTDTIYGFSCDPRNSEAVERIKELKKREEKPFLLVDSSVERLRNDYFCSEDIFTIRIIDILRESGLWPGKITLLAKKNAHVNYSFLKSYAKIGVRYTENKIIHHLCDRINCGLASTSINIGGEPSSNDIDYIISQWSEKVDFILNAGTKSEGSESTIIESESQTDTVRFVRSPDRIIESRIKKALSRYEVICR